MTVGTIEDLGAISHRHGRLVLARLTNILMAALLVNMTGCATDQAAAAIRSRDATTLKALTTNPQHANAKTRNGEVLLNIAIECGNKEAYEYLLAIGADPNTPDRRGSTPMHVAAKQDHVYWLERAFECGGQIDVINEGNRFVPNTTPLMYALSAAKRETALFLIDHGADLNHADSNGETPLMRAAGTNLFDLVIVMIERGADVSYKANRGKTMLGAYFNDVAQRGRWPNRHEEDWASYVRAVDFLVERGLLEDIRSTYR